MICAFLRAVWVSTMSRPPTSAAAEAHWSWQLQARIAALLFLAVLITRLPTFFRSVMDWDESLYFLMAEQWRAGHLPYTAIWDNKPIGIYGVFALFQSWFGDNVVSIRIASVLFITVTAFAVFKIALAIPLSERRFRGTCALFAGVAYVVCSLTNDGLSANTEIFMACFTSLAVLSALSQRAFLAGLMFGLAFMTKYVVLFEFPAIAFALLALGPPRDLKAAARSGLALLFGAALPLLATMALYAGTGHFHPWLEDSILSNFRRIAVPVSMQAISYIFNVELLRWSPLFLSSLAMLAMAAIRLARTAAARTFPLTSRYNLFLALWLVGGCIGVASAKSFFDHYFLQILPVMCITIAWLLLTAAPFTRPLSRLQKASLFTAILALPLLAAATAIAAAAAPVLAVSQGRIILQRDTPARIAHDIQPLLTPALPEMAPEQIFVFDYQPIIYSLAGQRPPTRYAFPSVLTKCQLAAVAKVRAMHEINRILAGNPEFIIRSLFPFTNPKIVNLRVYAAVDRTLAARYQVWRSYGDAIVYRLTTPDAPVSHRFDDLPAACPK
jgi:4-amino-4-deoxy-L-arabinose transferase-like glycosyltransferase